MKRVIGLFVVGFIIGLIAMSSAAAGLITVRLYRSNPSMFTTSGGGSEVSRLSSGVPVPGPRPVPPAPQGPLAGLVVYLSAGHGWLLHRAQYDGDPISWGRQRSTKYGMVEDDWTALFVADDLAPVLEEAGATVITLRERDRNKQRIIADDWITVPKGLSGFGDAFSAFGSERVEDDVRAEGGSHTRLYPGGSASWTLTAPTDGQWYLYVRWLPGEDLDDRAVYTVRMGDEVREVVVDQRYHGEHWWPLGNAALYAGAPVEVTLTGSGNLPLSADAVRLGGGSYEIMLPFNFKMRSALMWEVAMPHQLDLLGGPDWLAAYDCGNPVSDQRLRPHWASWASEHDEEAIYLSIHTNAFAGGGGRRGRRFSAPKGFTAFWGAESSPLTPADPDSVLLTQLLDKHVSQSVRANDKGYVDRGARVGDYSENSPIHNALPAALLEMGFHDHPEDAKRLQSQRFRTDAAEGILEGIIEWRESVPSPGAPPDADGLDGQGKRPWVRYE